MLIAKIYVNSDQIDEIHIQNVTKPSNPLNLFGYYKYEIRKPVGFNKTIWHKRTDGYKLLLIKALEMISE